MKISVPKGKYVLAVSGGVDSMVLLDLLAGRSGVDLVIAHFNHGIRSDSDKDEKLVRNAARKHSFIFEVGRGNLTPGTSEDDARRARYGFLNSIKEKSAAKKIITAHHQDDLIETAFLNILRGTGAKGLSALQSNPNILRPLLAVPKSQIISYARQKNLAWRDDPTNQNLDYLRNYVRHRVVARMSSKERRESLGHIAKVAQSQAEREQLIATVSQNILKKGNIDRRLFSLLPREVGNELVAYWLRQAGIGQFDKKTIERLSLALKTASAGTKHIVRGDTRLILSAKYAHFDASVDKS